jgi:uncharacterized protein (TIGR00369 family)
LREANHCFVCGRDNPIGLKLTFTRRGDMVRAEFTPSELHAGFEGLIHGGILAALMDDAMANVWYVRGQEAVTAKIEIRFRREARPGEPLVITAEPAGAKGGMVMARATVERRDGVVVAEGSGFLSLRQGAPS